MDIGIGASGVGPVAQPPGGSPSGPAPADVDANDAERFQAAMAKSDVPPPTTPEQPAAAMENQARAVGEASMGDRILDGMSSLSDKIQAGRAEAAAVLEKPEMTHTDLLKANMALLETGTLVTAASKTTEKITQGIKTLQQG